MIKSYSWCKKHFVVLEFGLLFLRKPMSEPVKVDCCCRDGTAGTLLIVATDVATFSDVPAKAVVVQMR
jgi:hypothetical protein